MPVPTLAWTVSSLTKIQDSNPSMRADLSLLNNNQTGSRAHPASYPVGNGGSFPPRAKWPKRQAEHSHPANAEVNNEWTYTSTPLVCHCYTYRNNFTFLSANNPCMKLTRQSCAEQKMVGSFLWTSVTCLSSHLNSLCDLTMTSYHLKITVATHSTPIPLLTYQVHSADLESCNTFLFLVLNSIKSWRHATITWELRCSSTKTSWAPLLPGLFDWEDGILNRMR